MTARPSTTGNHTPEPPDSPRARKKSFADVLTASISPTQPKIKLRTPQQYRGKPAIGITKSEIALLAADYRFALIGKFSHGRPLMHTVRKCFASLGLKGTYTLGSIDARHLLINLKLEEDYSRLWMKTALTLEGYPMRLFKWTPTFHPTHETPIAPVWITMPFLPVHLFNKNILYSIANLIGKPLKVDEPTANITRPSLARVCVELDLTRPLVESVWVSETLDEAPYAIRSEGFYQEIQYEYLPAYCSKCYHLGHNVSDCYYGKPSLPESENIRLPEKKENTKNKDQELMKMVERKEQPVTKGKEVMDESREAPKKRAADQGFKKDARKGEHNDLRVWMDKNRNKENKTRALVSKPHEDGTGEAGRMQKQVGESSKTTGASQNEGTEGEDLITLDEEPLEDWLVNKRPAVENKTIEAMMAELIPLAQLLPVCGVDKDSVVAEQRTVIEEPQELALEITIFEDQETTMQFQEDICIDDLEGKEYDLEEEPEAPDKHGKYSRDDLLLLETKATRRDDMSVHPHTHSRRKSVGDEVLGIEGLLRNDEPQRDDNLRRSTRTRKPTFKVKKSHIR